MKKLIIASLSAVILASGMSSCSSSESVVSNGFLQKRKYNKGFHKSFKKSIRTENEISEETLVLNENPTETYEIKSENKIATEVKPLVKETKDNNTEEVAEVEQPTQGERKLERVGNKVEQVITKAANKVEKAVTKNSNLASVNNTSETQEAPTWALYVLAFLIPWLAVGIATDWDVKKIVINLLLTLLFVIPGIIHAFIVVSKNT